MKRTDYSRRELLQRGIAVTGAAGVWGALGSEVFAQTAVKPQAKRKPAAVDARQGIACLRRDAGEAAAEILRQGGNAIDATVAALMVEFVSEPVLVGLGGYGGSLVFYEAKTGRVHAIDSDSRAPRKFDPATFNAASAMHGYLAVGVPGNAAGLDLALQKFGTLPFKTLARRGLELAEGGVKVTQKLANAFSQLAKTIDPASRRAFFPQGVLTKDQMWMQPDLARLIRRLGDEGLASFYSGDVAATIAKQVQANGGVLSEEDFHGFQATVVEPVRMGYRGYDLYTPPPPAGGLTSLTILKTLEQFDLAKLKPWGADYIELFAGASNLAWAERFKYFGDPDFVKIPIEELLSEKAAVARAEQLRQNIAAIKPPADLSSHTVNVTVIDKDQNIVCWTATHGGDFGAQVAIDGLGLMLGHGMSRFDVKPGGPNSPAPGKRPQHNMAPLAVLKDGKPVAGLGLPGGRRIVTVTAQLAVNLIDFHASPEEIVSSPRVHTEGEEPIGVSGNTPPAVVEELKRRGHRVAVTEGLGGGANAVIIDAKSAKVHAAASPGSSGVLEF